ncbi:MAG: hypothetical protein ACXVC2_12630 [Bacteroidia bacterium]
MKTTTIKKAILAIVALCFTITISAQTGLRGGIMGGVFTGPVQIENLGNRFTDVINGNNITGFEAGVFLKPQLGFIYIKPAALYQFSNGTVNYYSTTEGSGQQNTTFSMHKVEFPLLLGLNLPGPFYVEAGPSYNYIFSLTDTYNDHTLAVNQNALGYRVGVGAELGPLMLSVNMAGATYMASSTKATFREPYKLIFGLGFIFGGSRGGGE